MSGGGCEVQAASTTEQRRVLGVALALNATMFVVGTAAGILVQSSGLLADAPAYAVALLGASVIVDALRRALTASELEGWVMLAVATLALTANGTVPRMLRRYREGEMHLRASWIFTRADVIANLGVSGLIRAQRAIRDLARRRGGEGACLNRRDRRHGRPA